MIQLDVRADIKEATRYLDDLQKKQVPFATALALTRTARLVEADLQKAMARGFESASPYVKRSSYATSANKATLQVQIGLKDKKPAGGTAPSVLLKEHFGGGTRGNKPMEKALAAIGALPAGWDVVPGAGMPLDAYGNPRRNVVREIIGALRSGMQVHKGRGKNVGLVGYFVIRVVRHSHLHPGIYWRKGRAIRPMFLFVEHASYRSRFDLPAIGRRTVDREFRPVFEDALSNALKTAR